MTPKFMIKRRKLKHFEDIRARSGTPRAKAL
jgi:hypothetical protein